MSDDAPWIGKVPATVGVSYLTVAQAKALMLPTIQKNTLIRHVDNHAVYRFVCLDVDGNGDEWVVTECQDVDSPSDMDYEGWERATFVNLDGSDIAWG